MKYEDQFYERILEATEKKLDEKDWSVDMFNELLGLLFTHHTNGLVKKK